MRTERQSGVDSSILLQRRFENHLLEVGGLILLVQGHAGPGDALRTQHLGRLRRRVGAASTALKLVPPSGRYRPRAHEPNLHLRVAILELFAQREHEAVDRPLASCLRVTLRNTSQCGDRRRHHNLRGLRLCLESRQRLLEPQKRATGVDSKDCVESLNVESLESVAATANTRIQENR